MSEIKVNKISPRTNCGTVQLGDSGDTITIPSGATITNSGTANGFGADGAVNWQTSIKTATFTAANQEGYFCNTSGGAFTVNLPAASVGNIVAIKDYAGTFQTNNLTISPNGSDKIDGVNNDATISTENASITLVFADSTRGWLNVNDSTNVEGSEFITATGGTITTVCTNFKVHTFTGPGTFQVTAGAGPVAVVDYLVIGGGGGGGNNPANGDSGRGGGGGAGGYRESSGASSGCYTASPLGACVSALPVSVASYPVTVGAGAAGGYTTQGTNSVFAGSSTITSTGGGTGGVRSPAQNSGPAIAGNPGGSGGGAGTYAGAGPAGSGNTPPVSPPQGNDGGTGTEGPPSYGAGGGGGAGATGGTGSTSAGGAGGNGVASSITGSPVTRAGGGGGAVYSGSPVAGAGGSGGGGAGAGRTGPVTAGVSGTANTGGGGGGAGGTCGFTGAGTGGSGVVVIRYKFQ